VPLERTLEGARAQDLERKGEARQLAREPGEIVGLAAQQDGPPPRFEDSKLGKEGARGGVEVRVEEDLDPEAPGQRRDRPGEVP
jgi:hypothetical protein